MKAQIRMNQHPACESLTARCVQQNFSRRNPFVLVLVNLLLAQIRHVYSSGQRQQLNSIDRSVLAKIRQKIAPIDGIKKGRPKQTSGFFRTIPAFSHRKRKLGSIGESRNDDNSFYKLIGDKATLIQEVAVKTMKTGKRKLSNSLTITPQNSYEFLLGITPQTIQSISSNKQKSSSSSRPFRRVDLQESMIEALEELKSLRKQIEYIQKEIAIVKQLQLGIDVVEPEALDIEGRKERNLKRAREYEAIAKDVERWAEKILFLSSSSKQAATNDDSTDDLNDGWIYIPCHKMFTQKWNRNGATRAYLKYMKDSRLSSSSSRSLRSTKENVDTNKDISDSEWPCLRLYSIIDAPCSEVCAYLSQERHVPDYNQLLDKYQDLEIISPHSKICFASSPQLLFIKPRDLITFCSHRWKRDGTQIVVNQACDQYKDRTATAFALRGATYISPDPSDPDHKTQIAMLAHASPGTDLPKWACRTAIQSLLPIEPYRLFYKINEGVKQCRPELQEIIHKRQQDAFVDDDNSDNNGNVMEMVGNDTGLRSDRHKISRAPAGLAQMGYACFWPNGGGTVEDSDGDINNDSVIRPTLPSTNGSEPAVTTIIPGMSNNDENNSSMEDVIGEYQ
jgi:hypothetical protein